jgi:hypothetical protein
MRPERTFLHKLMLSIVGGILIAGVLLAGGAVFILVGVSMRNPNKMEVTVVEGETISEVYVRNRTHAPLVITMRMPQNYLPHWLERFRQINPSHYKAAVVWPVTGQPDSADVVQTVAPDSSVLLKRQIRSGYRNPDGTETTEQYEEGTYWPNEIVNGPHSFKLQPIVHWVDGRHHAHTQPMTLAEIGSGLVTDFSVPSTQKSKTVRYLDYR